MNFKPGDKVVCVEAEQPHFLKLGKIYTVDVQNNTLLKLKESPGDTFSVYRFKHFDKHQTFSALNAEDAKRFVGKIMEFTDGDKPDAWVTQKLEKVESNTRSPFVSFPGARWQFCRTCGETSEPNEPYTDADVTKIIERFIEEYQRIVDLRRGK